MSGSVVKLATRGLYKVFALSVVLTLALASAALADNVSNRIDTTADVAHENITLNEGATQTVAFRVMAKGNDLEAGCNIDPGEQLRVQVISSTASVATVSPQTLTFTDCNQNQSVTVAAGAPGTSIISVAQDLGVGSNTTGLGTYDYTPASFTVTVNSAPTISDIADQSTDEDTQTSDIPFTVGDIETAADDLTVSGSSSNTTLVPNSNITFGGSGANRTVKVTPAANQSGTATITMSVSDGTATTNDTFFLTVNPANDDPVVSSVTNNGPVSGGAPATITASANDVDGDTLSYEFDCNKDNSFEIGPQPANNAQCTFNDDGTYQVNVRVSDGNGGTATDFTNVTVNSAPWVTMTTPLPGAKKVSPKAMVTATFSEEMDEVSVEASGTFALKKGTKTVLATVSYDPDTKTATLDPSRKLKRGATYTAMVTTGAEDSTDKALASDKVWTFRVRR